MASPKIGKLGEGKGVKQMSISELKTYVERGGKAKLKALTELSRRNVT